MRNLENERLAGNEEERTNGIVRNQDLHASVDGHEILKGVNLTVNAGEVHSIMGPNGSGKSTLAQVLARRDDLRGDRRKRFCSTAKTCWR